MTPNHPPKWRNGSGFGGAFVAVVAIVLVAGCAGVVPMVSTKVHGQSPAQQATDETGCAKATVGAEPRDRAYAACMIARGYEMYVAPNGIACDARALAPTTAPAVAAGLQACETQSVITESEAARKQRVTTAIVMGLLASPLAFIDLAGPDRLEPTVAAYTPCMTARGYDVRRWSEQR